MIRSRSTEAAKPRIRFWKPGWLPSNRSSPMLPGHSAPAAPRSPCLVVLVGVAGCGGGDPPRLPPCEGPVAGSPVGVVAAISADRHRVIGDLLRAVVRDADDGDV